MSTNNVNELIDFVGRTEELEILNKAKNNLSQSNLIFISGDGGVGKTFLLRRFNEILSSNTDYFVLEHDFDDYAFHSPENLRLTLSQKWHSLSFDDYIEKYTDIDEAKKEGITAGSTHVKKLHEKATTSWIETIESIQKNNIIYFDTIDALSEIQIKRVGQYFFSYLPQNTLVIISGRPKEIEYLIKIIKTSKASENNFINLKPLSSDEYKEYINKKIEQLGYSSVKDLKILETPDEFIEFIKKASKGLPILIGLSLELLSPQNQNRKAYISAIKELRNNSNDKELHNDFKKILIRYFLNIHTNPLKQLVKVLAHAWPMGKNAIKQVLDLEDKDVEALMEKASKEIYIKYVNNNLYGTDMDIAESKYFLRLHDVIREMINQYGWSEHDSDKSFRKDVSTDFLEILTDVINKGREKLNNKQNPKHPNSEDNNNLLHRYSLMLLLQRLKIQIIRHKTCLSIKDGLENFIDIIENPDTETKESESQFIDQLNDQLNEIVTTYHNYEEFYKLVEAKKNYRPIIIKYFIQRLRFLVSRNRFTEASTIEKDIQYYIDKNYFTFEERISLLEEIASKKIKEGELKNGLELLKVLKEDCKKEKSFRLLFHIYVSLGWAYRLMGNIKNADLSYSDADDLLILEGLLPGTDIKIEEVATLYQTWAYVKALSNEPRLANDYIEIARSKYQEIKNHEGEARVESVLGRMKIEFDEYDEAIQHFEQAKNLFPEDNREWQSKVLLGIAYAHLLLYKTHKQENDIKFAYDYITTVKNWDLATDRPERLFISAQIALQQKKLNKSNKLFIEAIEESKQQTSLSFLYRALVGQVQVVISQQIQGKKTISSSELIETHKGLVQQYPDIKSEELIKSIFWFNIAHLKFLEDDNQQTVILGYYEEYLPIIAKNSRFYSIGLKGQLDQMRDIFISYATNQKNMYDKTKLRNVHKLAQGLWEFWTSKGLSKEYRNANPILRSMISGDLDKWNHPNETSKNKTDNNNE